MYRLIKDNRERKLNGLTNNIFFPFKKLNEYIPGIEREQYHIITANEKIESKLFKISGIYCIYSLISNKFYIGSSKNKFLITSWRL